MLDVFVGEFSNSPSWTAAPRSGSSDRLGAIVSVAGAFPGTNSGKRAAMREVILGAWGVPPERIT